MKSDENPHGVELAPLPRDRIGPFLTLGAPKSADAETIEALWARCVLWARQRKTATPLGDIHWARDVLRDAERRLAADVVSLNPETAADELRRLERLFHLDADRPAWTAEDPEPEVRDPKSALDDWPDVGTEQARLPAPHVPLEFPGVRRWLEELAREPLDPWSLTLSHHTGQSEESHE